MAETTLTQLSGIIDSSLVCEETGTVMETNHENQTITFWMDGSVYEVSLKKIKDCDYPE